MSILKTRQFQFLKSVLHHPNSIMSGTLQNFFEKGYLTKVPITSAFSQFREINNEIKMQCLESDVEGVTISELGIICWIACNTEPISIFEFGTADGRTALNLALNTSKRSRLWTLDLPIENRMDYYEQEIKVIGKENFNIPFKDMIGKCYQDHPLDYKITQLYGDSTQFDFSPYYGKMDLIFIDANHDYSYVKSDSENALKMLSEKGIILWHDYPQWSGVWRYLDELYGNGLPLFHIKGTKLACYSRFLATPNVDHK